MTESKTTLFKTMEGAINVFIYIVLETYLFPNSIDRSFMHAYLPIISVLIFCVSYINIFLIFKFIISLIICQFVYIGQVVFSCFTQQERVRFCKYILSYHLFSISFDVGLYVFNAWRLYFFFASFGMVSAETGG